MSDRDQLELALRKATRAALSARLELENVQFRHQEPIAIVGMGCRYPGWVHDPESYWRLLSEGVDAVTEVPAERWDIEALYDPDPEVSGKMTTRFGGFVREVDRFDAEFFGMAPREAQKLDPQQRLLLETSWEALERAGLRAETLMRSDTGVFVGMMYQDYGQLVGVRGGLEALDGYVTTGSAGSVASGRISYILGLQGPSMTVDTACSSSLVTLHLACQSLRQGECSVALAGGVALMLTPTTFVEFSRLRGLSSDGRCKSFSAAADGTGWSEGCGMLVLERLSDAQRNGHRVLALVRGTAVNQDGRSNGLTAPNGPSQQAVIRQALQRAGVMPSQVDYLECHGTGTALGDPVEVQALGTVLAEGRDRSNPVVIGSVKTNLGHTQAAAGVAGVIKVVLSLQHGLIPKSLHFASPSPHIAWSELPVKVAAEAVDWGRNGKPRIAGVSSFGISGTNAHAVLEEAPAVAEGSSAPSRSAELVVLSARTEGALRSMADRLREHMESHPELSVGDVAYSLVTTRSAMVQRLALSVPTRGALLEALKAASAGETPAGAARGEVLDSGGKLAWLFGGQGSQKLGMGRELYQSWPVFHDALEAAWSELDGHLDRPLRGVMWAEAESAEAGLLEQTGYTQPALFALEWALSALWRSWGVEPELLCGHSVGEIVAACVAGVMSMGEGARLVCARGRLMQGLPVGGAMVSVEASEGQVAAAVAAYASTVSIAAINGPSSVVISGDEWAVEAIASDFASRGTRTQRLKVSHAFHSARMDPMLGEFARVAESIAYRPAARGLVSNLSGSLAGGEESTPGYWVRHAREAVRFGDGVEAMRVAGAECFLEIGPKSTLLGLVRGCVGEASVQLVPSLRPGRSESESVLESLGGWFARGGRVGWDSVLAPGSQRVSLPTYPWQRERYWMDVGPDGPGPAIVEPIADWFYQVEWPEVPHARAGERHAESGRWLVLADRGGLGEAIAAALSSRGLSCAMVYAPAAASLVAEAAAMALEGRDALQGVLYLWGLDGIVDAEASADEVGEITRRAVSPALALIQALGLPAAGATRDSPRLWIATRGACVVGGESGVAPCQAALWGLGRVAALEHPAVWGGLVDLDPERGSTEVELLLAELLEPDAEDQLAFRKGRRHGARLMAATPKGYAAPVSLSEAGSYLVTGGLGALGLLVARWLVEKGARHLILSGRQGLPDRAAWGEAHPSEIRARIAAVQALEALGARVTVAAVDVADAEGMRALLTAVEPPLRGLVHTAGVGTVRVLAETDEALLESVLRSKVTGTWLLHRLLQDRPLDFFVLFSSGAAVWGGHGQGAYAAANAFLDGLAHQRRAQSLPALSVDWGIWADGQMGDAQFNARMSEIGVLPMATSPAFSALERLVGTRAVQCTVTRMDWARFAPVYAARGRRNLLAAQVAKGNGTPAARPGVAAARSWDGLSIGEVRTALRELVRQTVAGVLGFRDADSLDPRQGFAEQGLDSLMAVQIGAHLERKLGVVLPATLAFDHPTVERLATHLLTDVLRLEERVEPAAARSATVDERIAIVGAACRFPGGADDLGAYWKLLTEGGVAVSDVPASRWRAADWYDADPAPNRTYVSRGGFLRDDLAMFDSRFFRISPREAVSLDPQQRLLLEVSWEALEHAGHVPPALSERRTGVFVGVGPNEYAERLQGLAEEAAGLHIGTGNMLSVTAGRLSFFLGLHGPSLAVDTACSSSLVALHLGCQSLRLGECDRALVGGVNVLLSPASFVVLSRMRALAPDGRCKTFSAAADGYGRAEGCAVVVLKRLRDAERDGDRILGVIRGTAVNHDGASSGLTVPNGPAQEALLREALAEAGVAATDIDFVECHGTGTALGDPIEVHALSAVYGQGRSTARPLLLGSAKANLGHTEPAAGMAGLIKVLLALAHERIPAQPELGDLNPHVPWDLLPVAVAREATPWPRNARPRRAGVSAFGMSGTNAHVILEEAPATKVAPAAPERPAELLMLSANSAAALDAQAARLRDHMAVHAEQGLCDLALSLATTRTPMDHRLAVVATSREELRVALDLASQGQTPPGAARGTIAPPRGKLAFLFTGQGAQVLGMGRGLCTAWPAFREAFDRCVALFDRELDRPLREVMWAEPGSAEAAWLDETAFTQPALFALEYSLTALWRSWGVEPDLVLGHSIGELVAACVAGVFSLEDAVRLVAARGQCMQALPAGGAMLSISAPLAEVTAAVGPYAASVSIAAVNGPDSVVIAGAEEPVLALAAIFAARGKRTKRLTVSHAFHSPLMDAMPEDFRRVASTVAYRAPDRRLVSNVTGTVAGAEIATPEYWVRQLRSPVRFSDGIDALHAAGTMTFVEIGPKSTLLGLVPACLGQANVALVPSLRADRSEPQAVLAALGSWYAMGGSIDWKGVCAEGAHPVDLPTYAWQRERHWIDAPRRRATTASDAGRWPLAGVAIPMPGSVLHHVLWVGARHQVFLGDHLVFGRVVVAGAFHVSVILAIAAEHWPDRAIELAGVEFVRAIALEGGQEIELHAVLTPEGEGDGYRFELATVAEGEGWTIHARGRVQPTEAAPRALLEAEMLEDGATEPVDCAAAVFDRLSAMQIEWGPLWRWLRDARVGADLSWSTLAPTYPRAHDVAPVHPCLLDNGFGTMLLGGGQSDPEDGTPRVPFGVDRLRWWRAPEGSVRCRTALRPNMNGATDFILVDERGAMVAEVEGFTTRRAKFDSFLPQESSALTGGLYRLEWPDAPDAGGTRPEPGWVVVAAPGSEMAAELAVRLERCALTEPSGLQATLSRTAPPAGVICLWEARSGDGAAEAAIRVATEGLRVVQALDGGAPARFLWVTTGAVPVRPGDAVAAATAPVWGLGRTVMQERPELGCTLVDLEPGPGALHTLMRELSANDGESQVAWRAGRRHAARLMRAPVIAGERPMPLSIQGTVLLSGGLGALGLQVARWLAQQGVPHLVLTGRRGANTPGAGEAVVELEALGTRVTVAAIDVADREALKAVLEAIPGDVPLRGVVHAAGVLDDGVLAEQNAERFARVLSAKVKGAWNLHELTARSDLAFFVMFSSLSGLLGGAGQSNYAAANSFLDALAAHRRAEGLVGQSLAWGPWSEGGMAARLGAAQQARLARQGFGALSPAQGMALFGQGTTRPEAVLGLVSLDLRAVSRAFGAVVPSVWRSLVRGSSPRPHAAAEAQGVWARRLSTLPPAGRADEVRDAVLTDVASVLSLGDADAVPVDQPLSDLGLDSLMAVELRTALSLRVGLTLPATLAFDHPTVDALSHWLLDGVLAVTGLGAPVANQSPTVDTGESIAITAGTHVHSSLSAFEETRILEDGRGARCCLRWAELGRRTPPLLLLHGVGANHHYFAALSERLGGHDLLVPSLPGRCGSDGPPLSTVSEAARWVLDLLADVDVPQVVLVGHSYGGAIAMELAMLQAGLPVEKRPVAGLVLIGTPRLPLGPQVTDLFANPGENAAAADRALSFLKGTSAPEASETVLRRVAEALRLTPMAASASDFAAVKASLRGDPALEGIHLPALVLVGSEDRLAAPRYARYLARHISKSRLVVLQGVGHHPPLEATEQVAEQIMSFLDDFELSHAGSRAKHSYVRGLSPDKATSR